MSEEEIANAWKLEAELEEAWERAVLKSSTSSQGSWEDVANNSKSVVEDISTTKAEEPPVTTAATSNNDTVESNITPAKEKPSTPSVNKRTFEEEAAPALQVSPTKPMEISKPAAAAAESKQEVLLILQPSERPNLSFFPPASAAAKQEAYTPLPKDQLLQREREKNLKRTAALKQHLAQQIQIQADYVRKVEAQILAKREEIAARAARESAHRNAQNALYARKIAQAKLEYEAKKQAREEEIAAKTKEVAERIARFDAVRREREKKRESELKLIM